MKWLFENCGQKMKKLSWYYLGFGIVSTISLWILLSQLSGILANTLSGAVDNPNYNLKANILTYLGFYVFILSVIYLLLLWLFKSQSRKIIGYEETIQKEHLDLTSPVGLNWRTLGKSFIFIAVFLDLYKVFINVIKGNLNPFSKADAITGIPNLQEQFAISESILWVILIFGTLMDICCHLCIGYLIYGHGEKKLVEEFNKEKKEEVQEA